MRYTRTVAGAPRPFNSDPDAILLLIEEARVLRHAVHELVTHMQQQRYLWERTVTDMTERPRLTAAQQRRLRSARRHGGSDRF